MDMHDRRACAPDAGRLSKIGSTWLGMAIQREFVFI